jgi:hypothetical protein
MNMKKKIISPKPGDRGNTNFKFFQNNAKDFKNNKKSYITTSLYQENSINCSLKNQSTSKHNIIS